jgi:GntR family transcriptional repressor for pyruvate dehydrogenase complex
MQKFPAIVTAGLAKQIAESLREQILSGQIKVAERLPTEEELARRFGVSRPTIREALKRLAAENLIHSRRGPRGGSMVKHPRPEEASSSLSNALRLLAGLGEFDQSHIFEARCEMESTCCRLAAKRRNKDYLAKMRAELATQRDPSLTDEEFCASDVRFHRAMVEATDNPILQFMLCAVSDALQPVTNLVVFRFRDRKVICLQHQRLIEALEISDAGKAVAVLQKQARYLAGSYRKARAWRQSRESRRGKDAKASAAR